MGDIEIREFPTSHLRMPLRDGIVGDWLVAGPLTTPLDDPAAWAGPDRRGRIVRAFSQPEPEVTQPPCERSLLSVTRPDGESAEFRWQVAACAEDGLLYRAGETETLAHVAAWAYAQLILPEPRSLALTLTTAGPVTVWVNGEQVLQSARFYDERPGQLALHLPLNAGTSEVLIRQETVARGAYVLTLGLALAESVEDAAVVLPTALEPVARRQKLAAVMAEAYTLADVLRGKDKVTLHWPAAMNRVDALTIRLQTPSGRIYAEATPIVQAGSRLVFGTAEQFPTGDYQFLLMPQAEEYYVQEMRVERRLPFRLIKEAYSALYYGTPESRREEALADAAKRGGIWAEAVRVAQGETARVAVVEQTVARVNRRVVGYRRDLLGLLTLTALDRQQPRLSTEMDDVVAAAVIDACSGRDEDAEIESPLVADGCRALAAMLYPEQVAAAGAKAGLVEELRTLGVQGLRAWLASAVVADALAVLACLVQFGTDDALADLAGATLDRLCLDLAIHSFQGMPAGSRSTVSTAALQSGLADPLSGVARLLWGIGVFGVDNHATVALALADAYELPEIIAAIAVNRDAEALTRACHAAGSPWQADQVVYRTPDYFLSALTGYRPGQRGEGELIWQAVLGPEAMVHVNFPANACRSDALVSNYWRGDGALPRVAQWRNVVMAVYAGTDEVGLGYSHAYFPVAAFDEHVTQDGWLFGRKGTGYVALTAGAGVDLLSAGPTAQREARSPMQPDQGNIWLCQMGREAVDGSFADFVAAVCAQETHFELGAQPRIRLQSPRGEELVFGWEGDFTVDGVVMPLTDYPLLSGPYAHVDGVDGKIEVRYGEAVMLLDFGPGTTAQANDAT